MVTKRGSISQAVADALEDAQLLPRDAAAVALVKRYAAALDASPDAPEVLVDLGPKLLAALTALGMTLSGRAAKTTKGDSDGPLPGAEKLDELRARRAARANRATAVDTTAS